MINSCWICLHQEFLFRWLFLSLCGRKNVCMVMAIVQLIIICLNVHSRNMSRKYSYKEFSIFCCHHCHLRNFCLISLYSTTRHVYCFFPNYMLPNEMFCLLSDLSLDVRSHFYTHCDQQKSQYNGLLQGFCINTENLIVKLC